MTEELKNLTVRLHKDGKVYRKISDQLKTVTAAGIRRYRMSQSTTNQSDNGHPPKITQQKGRYLHNLVLKKIGTGVISVNQRSFCDNAGRHCII